MSVPTIDPTDTLGYFQALLPQVRQHIKRFTPMGWPEIGPVMGLLTETPAGPLTLLPLACCQAVGGQATEAIPLAAAWRAYSQAMRILDDLQDQDRSGALWAAVGPARAFNFGAALYALCQQILATADWPAEHQRRISQLLAETGLRLLTGQDRDLRGDIQSLDDAWRTMEEKNAAAFAFICSAGALCGSDDEALIEACGRYGYHLGLLYQLFDDFQGLWEPDGEGDLYLGKVTLPLLYGLSFEHPRRTELRGLVAEGNLPQAADRIRHILDEAGAREFMIWSALQERERAVAAIKNLPGKEGCEVLTAIATAAFSHIDELLPED